MLGALGARARAAPARGRRACRAGARAARGSSRHGPGEGRGWRRGGRRACAGTASATICRQLALQPRDLRRAARCARRPPRRWPAASTRRAHDRGSGAEAPARLPTTRTRATASPRGGTARLDSTSARQARRIHPARASRAARTRAPGGRSTAPLRRTATGTPATCTANSARRACGAARHVPPARRSPNSTASAASASAITSLPAGSSGARGGAPEALAVAARADPERPVDALGVERPRPARRCRAARSCSTSSSSPPVEKPPRSIRSSTRVLDRRPLDVGVEADVAEEHAVGRRHGLAAHADRARAAQAAGHFAQARLDVGRRVARQRARAGHRDVAQQQAQPGQLLLDLARAPARSAARSGAALHGGPRGRAASRCAPPAARRAAATSSATRRRSVARDRGARAAPCSARSPPG